MTKAKKTPLNAALAAAAQAPSVSRRKPIGANTDRVDRAGKVNVTGYFDPAVRQSIRMIQVQRPELTQQEILAEALNLVFAKYGVPESANVND